MMREKKQVLFICTHNSGRSQMAEAFFNRYANGGAKAVSAGTHPADKLNPLAIEVMKESGIDVSRQRPKLLTAEMLDDADVIITMGCGVDNACPAAPIPTIDWGLAGPEGQPIEKVRQIRDEIDSRVKRLVAWMDKESQKV